MLSLDETDPFLTLIPKSTDGLRLVLFIVFVLSSAIVTLRVKFGFPDWLWRKIRQRFCQVKDFYVLFYTHFLFPYNVCKAVLTKCFQKYM